MASPPYRRLTLLLNDVDVTDLLVPDSLSVQHTMAQGQSARCDYRLKQVSNTFQVTGGQRVDVYLPLQLLPVFSGQQIAVRPQRYAPQSWHYDCSADGWESVFRRRLLFTALRGVTYAGALQQILSDATQSFPTLLLKTVLDPGSLLTGAMPFYSINGLYPAEIFDFIATLTSTVWRVVSPNTTNVQVEFLDPLVTSSGWTVTNSNNTQFWSKFQPTLNLSTLINQQSVRGNEVQVDTPETVYFRGDGLNSKFDIPTKPFSNTASVIVFDSFNSQPINASLWLESDIVGNTVYADGSGFIQYANNPGSWVGLISRSLVGRDQAPIMVADLTWVSNGRALIGLTAQDAVGTPEESFLEAGFLLDGGYLYGVGGGSIVGQVSPATLTLAADMQIRFRIRVKAGFGCILEYQTGANLYTRTWTLAFDTPNGNLTQLASTVMNKTGGFSLALVKTTLPYLGMTLEVDRGTGFEEEVLGIYPVDEDVDAVIVDETTLAFFGSNPGPSSIVPVPTWNPDFDYQNIRLTYRRGVTIFATVRNSQSILDVAGYFGGGDNGVREAPVIVDPSITTYGAALARGRVEIDNRSSLVEAIQAETALNVLADAGYSLPDCGKFAQFNVTLPTTGYVLSVALPIRKRTLRGRASLADMRVALEAGSLPRGLQTVIQELISSGKLVSINENQILYLGTSLGDTLTMSDTCTVLGSNSTAAWGDSRLNRTFTVNTGTDVLTLSSNMVFATADPVTVTSTTTLPAGLVVSTVYYLRKITNTTATLHTSAAGANANTGIVDMTTTGSGTHTIQGAAWRWGQHRWNSFLKQAPLVAAARLGVVGRIL